MQRPAADLISRATGQHSLLHIHTSLHPPACFYQSRHFSVFPSQNMIIQPILIFFVSERRCGDNCVLPIQFTTHNFIIIKDRNSSIFSLKIIFIKGCIQPQIIIYFSLIYFNFLVILGDKRKGNLKCTLVLVFHSYYMPSLRNSIGNTP